MKKVGKVISVLIVMLICLYFKLDIIKAVSPSSDGYIKVTINNSEEKYLRNQNNNLSMINNITYQLDTNTLTFDNYDSNNDNINIELYNMGDLKVVVKGNNKINKISDLNINYNHNLFSLLGNTNLYISGNGNISFSNGKFIDSSNENNIEIKDVSINIEGEYLSGIEASNSEVFIENSNINFDISTSYSLGVFAKNIKIKDSKVNGYSKYSFINAKNKLEIINSKLDYYGCISGSDVTIDNNSKLNYKKINGKDNLYYQNDYAIYGLNININGEIKSDGNRIFGSNITINGNVEINNSKGGIYGESITVNNGSLLINNSPVGIVSKVLKLKSGTIDIKNTMVGIYVLDDNYSYENSLIDVSGGMLSIEIVDNDNIKAKMQELTEDNTVGFIVRDIVIYPMPIGIYTDESDKSIIKLRDNIEIIGGDIYSALMYEEDEYKEYIHYIATKKATFDFENDNPLSALDDKRVYKLVIKDKNYNPKEEDKNETKKEDENKIVKEEKVSNPKTGDINIYIVVIMIILSVGVIKVSSKKLKKNK